MSFRPEVRRRWRQLAAGAVLSLGLAFGLLRLVHAAPAGAPGGSASGAPEFKVPPDSLIPRDEVGASILRGRALAEATRDSLPHNVGSKLRCTSCHLDSGTRQSSGTWVGVYASFPQFNKRAGRVFQIEDRINECFRRSMNGKPLAMGSRDLRDLVAYMAWLSTGVPQGSKMSWLGLKKLTPVAGDSKQGERKFAASCVRCHGASGQGTVAATPLWGPNSFALGAGMARRNTLAAFLRGNMPFDSAGTLSDQQAFDLAAFILSHPRPRTPGVAGDWPAGDAPDDCPYPTRAGKAKAVR